MSRVTGVSLLFLLSACNGAGKVGGNDSGGPPGPQDGGATSDGGSGGSDSGGLGTDQGWCAVQRILNTQCVSCHGSASPLGGLDLLTDPYNSLVGQTSPNFPSLTLVVPGDPDHSFLMAKVEGTMSADQGTIMPPTAALSSTRLQALRDWITAGASSSCDDPGGDTGVVALYHPDGYSSPTMHGIEAKFDIQRCTDCHASDLSGGSTGVICDSCHQAGWRTNCTYCHGGVDNSTGAPPEDIDDSTSDLNFGAHSRHVQENTHGAYDCKQCHVKPTDVLSSGHMWDSTPAQAEVTMARGLSPSGTWSTSSMTCNNSYCHGNGRTNGSVTATDGPLSCHACHPDNTSSRSSLGSMSGRHEDHAREGVSCADCHHSVIDSSMRVIAPSLHVNGIKEFSNTSGVTYTGGRCTGTCHGERHDSTRW